MILQYTDRRETERPNPRCTPALAAAGILIAMILLREAIIRLLFSWLVRHLGEVGLSKAAA